MQERIELRKKRWNKRNIHEVVVVGILQTGFMLNGGRQYYFMLDCERRYYFIINGGWRCYFKLFILVLQPIVGYGLLVHEVS
jgi:hypothetical protein